MGGAAVSLTDGLSTGRRSPGEGSNSFLHSLNGRKEERERERERERRLRSGLRLVQGLGFRVHTCRLVVDSHCFSAGGGEGL